MRLRYKKTGEIVELEPLEIFNTNGNLNLGDAWYSSIKDFVADWEDAPEEPKGMQWVDVLGANDGRVVIQYSNEEEAELAVRKLKAWKRLKDKGFRIASVEVVEEPYNGLGQDAFRVEFVVDDLRGHRYRALDYENDKDLSTCFGGKK